jgi:hypothetical protein
MFGNSLKPRPEPILTLATDDNIQAMEVSDSDDEDIEEIIITDKQAIPVASSSQQLTL